MRTVTESSVISLIGEFSVSLVLRGGRVSLAHLMEFSHFVDLYGLHDSVYMSDLGPEKTLAPTEPVSDLFTDDRDSPLRGLPPGPLADAVYWTSEYTLSIYDWAPEQRTFSFSSYRGG